VSDAIICCICASSFSQFSFVQQFKDCFLIVSRVATFMGKSGNLVKLGKQKMIGEKSRIAGKLRGRSGNLFGQENRLCN
jgi:hypothetical protein